MKKSTIEAARGKWAEILSHFGIDESILNGKHHPCPLCGEGRDRFRFINTDGAGTYVCNQCGGGDGMKMLMSHTGWDFKAAASAVDRIVGNLVERPAPAKRDPLIRLNQTTRSLRPVSDAVRVYLRNRGLRPSKGIHSASVPYYDDDGKNLGNFDAMVCPIQKSNGELINYHITYLSGGRKAPVPKPKKFLPALEKMTGSAIRLTGVYPTLGIAEGVETALAVMELYKMPCWAAANAGMLQDFIPPADVIHLVIYADHDENHVGARAAYELAWRAVAKYGITAEVKIPEVKGHDFADVLVLKLREGIGD